MSDHRSTQLTQTESIPCAQEPSKAALNQLYEDARRAVVKLETDTGTGSAFFVDKEGHVATVAHVVLNAKEIFAITSQGKRYRARLEKLDDNGDLAELKLEDFDGSQQKFLEFGSSKQLKGCDRVFALGHPKGSREVVFSAGTVDRTTKLYDLVNKDAIAKDFARATPQVKSDWLSALSRPIVHGSIQLDRGNSGGPLIDSTGKVVGIADFVDERNKARSYYLSVEDLRNLHTSDSKKFEFHYQHQPSTHAESFLGGWKASQHQGGVKSFYEYTWNRLKADTQAYQSSTYHKEAEKYSLSMFFDGSILGGSYLSVLPGLQMPGALITSIGLAGRISADSLPYKPQLQRITRTDGDKRPPFDWEKIPSK